MPIGQNSERVKAWIYVVINPLARALEIESTLLASGNSSYRWTSDRLEVIRAVEDHLAGPSAALILEDLCTARPEVRDLVARHDEKVRSLEQAARDDFKRLAEDDEFLQVVQMLKASEPKLKDFPTRELTKWASQRVLNSETNVSNRWEDAPLWTAQNEQTIGSYRSRPERARAAMKALTDENQRLQEELRQLRLKLVDEYDVPPAYVDVAHVA